MTTSSNITWQLDRDDLIGQAYAKLGIPGEDNTLTANQIAKGLIALNSVVAVAITDGMPLWKRTSLVENLSSSSNQTYTVTDAVKVADVIITDVGGVQYSLKNKSLYDFNLLPTNSVGVPVHWTWQPLQQGSTVRLWPYKSDATTVANKTISIIYQKQFDDFVSSADTMDFPVHWTLAIVYRTAMVLAPDYGLPLEDRATLEKQAEMYWAASSGYGDEDGSFYVQPERRY